MYQRHSNLLGYPPPFLPWKSNLKISILTGFLSLKKTLVITFDETRAPISRKHVTEQGIMMSNL